MLKYKITWLECRLPTGQEFAVAVCGYSGKVCYLTLGNDVVTRMMISCALIEAERCQSAQHCLALGCQLNMTERGHMLHMLEMFQDEELDEKTSEIWSTESTLDGLVAFAEKMNLIVPDDIRKRQNPINID